MSLFRIILLTTALLTNVGFSNVCATAKYLVEKSALLQQDNSGICSSVCTMNAAMIVHKIVRQKELPLNGQTALWDSIKDYFNLKRIHLVQGTFAYELQGFAQFLFEKLGIPATITTQLTHTYAKASRYTDDETGVATSKDLLEEHIIPTDNSLSIIGVATKNGHAILVIDAQRVGTNVDSFGVVSTHYEIKFIDPNVPNIIATGELTQKEVADFEEFPNTGTYKDFLFSLPSNSELRKYVNYYDTASTRVGAATIIRINQPKIEALN